jgi:3-dehydroquinate synthase
MKSSFSIQDIGFSIDLAYSDDPFVVASKPRDYQVTFLDGASEKNNLEWKFKSYQSPILLIDNIVFEKYSFERYASWKTVIKIDAREDNKNIETVLQVCDSLKRCGASRSSMVFVVGGGILQDIGAFACYMFKRGVPWTFVPTTLLSQGDSCVGGKTAVNSGGAKNILGLFSAPREVLIDAEFIKTLSENDIFSGLGEIFRLLVTGGESSFQLFERVDLINLKDDLSNLNNLIYWALRVKQQIVEHDEFELDIRRSMNYGHSIGHALEALTNFSIPHGTAVVLGILIENRISMNRKILSPDQERRIFKVGRSIVPDYAWRLLANVKLDRMQEFLSSDKKVEGASLKLATLGSIGHMVFLDLPLNSHGLLEVNRAIEEVLLQT